jgi:hypothetical protein
MKRLVLITICLVGSLAIGASAQQAAQKEQPAVFRSSTRLVINTVVVKDKDGKVIEGLTAKDFIVTEDRAAAAGHHAGRECADCACRRCGAPAGTSAAGSGQRVPEWHRAATEQRRHQVPEQAADHPLL